MSTLPGEIVPVRVEGAKRRETVDGVLFYGVGASGWVLNETADRIWALVDGRNTLSEIAAKLGQPIGIPGVALEPDIQLTLAILRGRGFVTFEPGPLSSLEVDWRRMARPQDDGYDLAWYRELIEPRRFRGSKPTSTFLGAIGLMECYEDSRLASWVTARADHPNLQLTEETLGRWPAARAELCALVHQFHPMVDTKRPDGLAGLLLGSHSHSAEEMLGTVVSTVNCPLMLADNLVHELAHIKLFTLGVYKESSVELVLNSPSEKYRSPVRPNPRPMSAVLHAAYAFAHVAELETRVCKDPPPWLPIELIRHRLTTSQAKVAAAVAEVRSHVRTDEIGQDFLAGFFEWTDELGGRSGTGAPEASPA